MPHKTITIKLRTDRVDDFVARATELGLIEENADGDLVARPDIRGRNSWVYPGERRYHIRAAIQAMLAKKVPQEATPKKTLKTIGLI